jgi:hypothetical protein
MADAAEKQVSEAVYLERLARVRRDPWEFLKLVRTKDQVDFANPIKPYPTDLVYAKLYTRIWQREKLMAVPKSRRMIMSWTNVALALWETWLFQGRAAAIVSKKEDDADELLQRCKFIIDNLDYDYIPRELFPQYEYAYCNLRFPEVQSDMRAFPQGADQLRQFTFSSILADEMAFWERAEDMYSSAKPTIDGGGRFVANSSAGPGFFQRLVNDQINASEDELSTGKVTMHQSVFPMEGVEVWRNAMNRFFVFQLHYTANPAKRSAEFREQASSSMPKLKFLQEYEIKWLSFAGIPVYPDWNATAHGSRTTLDPEPGLPLLRGWDWGLTPACVIAQLQGDRLIVLAEITANNMGAKRFTPKVVRECAQQFPNWTDQKKHYIDYIDPAGFARSQSDETACAQALISAGMRPIAGAITWEERREAVEHFLAQRSRHGASFQLDIGRCPILYKGFEGGYRYPEKMAEIEPAKIKPLKDVHSHAHDALQMIASRVTIRTKRGVVVDLPRLQYAFGGGG